jgi:MFS family permease
MHNACSLNASLYRVIFGHALAQASLTGLRTALPLYALAHASSATDVGVLMGCFSVWTLLLSVPIGRYVDRQGLHAPWRLSVWLAVAAGGLCALVPVLWGMAGGAMLIGVSAALSQLAAQHYAGMSVDTPQQRTQVMGWLMLAPALASLLGPVTAGLLLDRAGAAPADRRSLAAVCVAIALLALASQWLVRGVSEQAVQGQHEHRSEQPVAASRWAVARIPGLMIVMLMNGLVFTCWTAYLLIVPMLGHSRGLSASMVGTIFGAFAVASALVRPFLTRLTAIVPERPLTVLSCALMAAAVAAFPLVSTALAYLLCSTIFGLGMGCVQVLLMTSLTEIVPRGSQGEALGLRLMTYSISNIAIPVLLGAIGAALGIGAMFGVTAGVAMSASGIALRARYRRD